jgi:nucleotide-binding universal stress UspA family protein
MLVHVQAYNPFYFEIPEPLLVLKDTEKIDRFVQEKLEELSKEVQAEYGITPVVRSPRGQVSRAIMQLAQHEKTSLIVMGTHGAKGFEELFIGSNASKVVNLAPCPVLTVQAHAAKPGFTNIVLPIDRSMHSREKVATATMLAKAYGAKLHVLGLLDENDVTDDTNENEYGKLQIVLDQVQHAIEAAGIPFTRHTVKGTHLAAEALKYGQSVNADLIIIMTDHESALTGLFMGPRAKQIVNHSRIPVLSIKPHYHEFSSLDLSGGYTVF